MSHIVNPLATPVSIANGGTNSSTALNNDEMIISHGGAIIENTNFTFDSTDSYLSSSTQARCVAFNSTTQSIPDSTFTAITLDSNDVNVGSMHSTSTNTSRVTVPTSAGGYYFVTTTTSFPQIAGFEFVEAIKKNGTTFLKLVAFASSSAVGIQVQVMWQGVLNAGDYVELYVFMNTGATQNVGNASRSGASELTAVKLW